MVCFLFGIYYLSGICFLFGEAKACLRKIVVHSLFLARSLCGERKVFDIVSVFGFVVDTGSQGLSGIWKDLLVDSRCVVVAVFVVGVPVVGSVYHMDVD